MKSRDPVAATKRRDEGRAIIKRVAVRHFVAVKALAGAHPSRQKQHVVMARCNAAADLRAAGYEWKEIASLLGMKGHPLAIRSARRWAELLSESEGPNL